MWVIAFGQGKGDWVDQQSWELRSLSLEGPMIKKNFFLIQSLKEACSIASEYVSIAQ